MVILGKNGVAVLRLWLEAEPSSERMRARLLAPDGRQFLIYSSHKGHMLIDGLCHSGAFSAFDTALLPCVHGSLEALGLPPKSPWE